MISADTRITKEFIDEVCQRLSQDKQIRRTLPDNGRIHIDRKLPYLCIYRRPENRADNGTEKLVKGEASYLVCPGSINNIPGLPVLLKRVIETLSAESNAFLIIEIWSKQDQPNIIDPVDGNRIAPEFRILARPSRLSADAIQAMRKSLSRITVSRNRATVSIDYNMKPWPERFQPVIPDKVLEKMNCFLLGIEISPIYRDPASGELFPVVLNRIHRGLSVAMKKAAFEFAHRRTKLRPSSYMSLGRRAVVKAVWEVDRRLAEISNLIDFLLLVTPVNIEQAWNKFRYGRFQRTPVFYYRPIPVDPSVLKRKLYDIPFDRIEDPVLSSLFHRKMVEMEMKLSMLRDRNTRNFFFGSMQLYGEINDSLRETAINLLEKIPPKSHELGHGTFINATVFADRAKKEIDYYRSLHPGITSTVQIRDDITGLMVSSGNLFLSNKVRIAESRVEALIQHEVGTHVVTYINGKDQPFQQLYCGLAGMDELQEGLAVLAEYLVGGLSLPRLRLLAGRVSGAGMLIDGAGFMDVYRNLHEFWGFNQRTAYIITSRLFRSGGLTKDAVYLRGLVNLIDYIRSGGETDLLFMGKISINDLALLRELRSRKILKPALLVPRYLTTTQSINRLEEIKMGKKILKLI